MNYSRLIDISRPVDSTSACFPGDVPFSRSITLTVADSKICNLTSFTMSPHVGTHADAASHIKGDLTDNKDTAGQMALEPFVGACRVIDVAPFNGELIPELIDSMLDASGPLPPRVLFRTREQVDFRVFESNGAWLSPAMVHELARRNVRMIGLDTPSVDNTESKTLDAHHVLDQLNMFWLENLDLSMVKAGDYFLVALPLKFTELEASPVRAILLE